MRAALLSLTVLLLAGCGSSEPDTFACDRGLRGPDWAGDSVKTARSLAKCGWLVGRDRDEVRRVLGNPTWSTVGFAWNLGATEGGYGSVWVLTVKTRDGVVVDADVGRRPL